ncbi:MAG: mannonate dehydratase [Roseobacter sp.]
MKQCWRWFGPADTIKLETLHQAGVEGIVTALHHIPPGHIWTDGDIRMRIELLAAAGFTWDVVESLPVSEAIKTQSTDCHAHLAAYKQSLRNLAARGIGTVCYNFMPILDWTRTELQTPQPHGGTAMTFRLLDFSVFDIHLLKRRGAADDYSQAQQDAAQERFQKLSSADKRSLQNNIVAGLPGANDNWTVDDVLAQLGTYRNIDANRLRQNLIDFLAEICPLAQDLGIRLCCHPDDPPFGLLGLPRVMSSQADYATIMNAVPMPTNGITFCTGSLGVAPEFDPVAFVSELGSHIHFVHLRNTKRLTSTDYARPDFFEAAHLEGDTDMVATIKALTTEQSRRRTQGRTDCVIPMRPDHGQELLTDLEANSMPGYPLVGRMRGLAELRGIMTAVAHKD